MGRLTIEGILSYPTIFKAEKFKNKPNSDPRFGCSVLIYREHNLQLGKIKSEIQIVQDVTWPQGMPSEYTGSCIKPYKDDDKYLVFRAYAKEDNRPTVVDVNGEDITDPSIAVAGKMAKMCASIYTYDDGITAGLEGVMILEEMGELGRLGVGKPTKEEMFGTMNQTSQPPVSGVIEERPSHIMTAKARGIPYQQFIDDGWSDPQLIEQGYMYPSVKQAWEL